MSESKTTVPVSKSPFWQFSIKFYAVPGVAEACIELQDQAKVDVNILFFLLWNATQGRTYKKADVAEVERLIGAWRDMAVVPIRNVRRALKVPPAVMTPEAAEGFRTRIKAVELEAERLQQEAMYELVGATPRGQDASSLADAARGNIAAYEAMGGKTFPKPAIETLLAALPASGHTTED